MTLQDTVRYFTEETEILPCLSVTCGGAGLCVQARGGVINEQGTPVSDRTLFDLASLTKLFTGLLTMRLWEEGRLDLTRPVTDYAPQYRYLSDIPPDNPGAHRHAKNARSRETAALGGAAGGNPRACVFRHPRHGHPGCD